MFVPCMIPNIDNVIIPLDIAAPGIIARRDVGQFMPISQLSRAPAYIPVPGMGMATKSTKPSKPYFAISGDPRLLVFSTDSLKKDHFTKALLYSIPKRSLSTENTSKETTIAAMNTATGCTPENINTDTPSLLLSV